MSLKIGITGGIGSGKSTILKIFLELGGVAYYADMRAKELINTSPEIKQQIISIFGKKAYQDEIYQASWMASIVFKNRFLLHKLNNIVHPAVWKDFHEFCNSHPNQIIFYEAALIFENQNHHLFDKTILVSAPINIKTERIKERDNISETQIHARMSNQLSDEEKRPLADFEIINTDLESTRKQVLDIYKEIRDDRF
jgi:dephospho-CoA kinase